MNSQTLLSRAHQHLAEVARTGDGRERLVLIAEAVILTAAAVECEVNWTLVKPLLFIGHDEIQSYARGLVSAFKGARIRQKIAFLLNAHSELSLSKKQKTGLKHLFDLRNGLLHSSPELTEAYYLPDDWDVWGKEIAPDEFPRKQILRSQLDIDKLDQVGDSISTAETFIAMLQGLDESMARKYAATKDSTSGSQGAFT